jgi:outer membrane lipoprotein-sorting protein
VRDKILNIAQLAGVIFVVASLVFRSPLAGALVLLPLLLAVLVNFGMMLGWGGILLNIPNSLSSAMAIGIGADYAIYLIYRMREELSQGTAEHDAVRKVLATAGKASLFVASAVAVGYSVLLLSKGFYIHVWLGMLIATSMIASVFAALTLIPSLILQFRPNFVFRPRKSQFKHAAARTVPLLLVFIAFSLLPREGSAGELGAIEIMEKNYVVSKVLDSVSNATFTLINKSGQQRVRKTFGTTKLHGSNNDTMRMTRFLSPPDIKGTVTLLIEHSDKNDDIWVYLPALKKVRRLVSSNKKNSFVGTDFSYGDILGHKVGEWNHRIVKEDVVDAKPAWVIESTPKTEQVKNDSGYSKRVGWILKDNFVTVKGKFYDVSGQLLKTTKASDVQLVDKERNKWQPMKLEAENVQTSHQTAIEFENFRANQNVRDDYFTTRYMERER